MVCVFACVFTSLFTFWESRTHNHSIRHQQHARRSVCTSHRFKHTHRLDITCIVDVLLTATRSSTHFCEANRGSPSLSSRNNTPHSTHGYRCAIILHVWSVQSIPCIGCFPAPSNRVCIAVRPQRPSLLIPYLASARCVMCDVRCVVSCTHTSNFRHHRTHTCEIEASSRGSTESSAPQNPTQDSFIEIRELCLGEQKTALPTTKKKRILFFRGFSRSHNTHQPQSTRGCGHL